MKLYKIQSSNLETFFGTIENPIARDITVIAQTPSCDAFLLLSKDAQDGLALKASVPDGFDFTYCQEWGLTIDDDVVARVILDLRKNEYPSHNDCIHALLDGGDTLTDLQAKRTIIKDKYPK